MIPVLYECGEYNLKWTRWLEECVGQRPDDWTYCRATGADIIWFARAEDATAFKLKFGL